MDISFTEQMSRERSHESPPSVYIEREYGAIEKTRKIEKLNDLEEILVTYRISKN